MLAVWEVVISTKLEEACAYHAEVEQLWAHLQEERKAHHNDMTAKLDVELAKTKMDASKKEPRRRIIVRSSGYLEILSSPGGMPIRRRRSPL
jgi:hypothetical protein